MDFFAKLRQFFNPQPPQPLVNPQTKVVTPQYSFGTKLLTSMPQVPSFSQMAKNVSNPDSPLYALAEGKPQNILPNLWNGYNKMSTQAAQSFKENPGKFTIGAVTSFGPGALKDVSKAGIDELVAPVVKKSGILSQLGGLKDQLVTDSRTILNKMGQGGKNAAASIDQMYNTGERLAGGLVADYKNATSGLNKQSLENVLRFLDGQPTNLNPNETQAAGNLRGILNKVSDLSTQADLQIKTPSGTKVPFAPRENYIPHLIDTEKLKAFKDQTIQHLVDTGQMPQETASAVVNDLINGKSLADTFTRYFPNMYPKRMGNLEFARILDLPKEVLRYDQGLLPDYLSGASNRLSQAQTFGANNENLTPVLQQIAQEGADPRIAEDILKKNLNLTQENPALKQGVGALRQIEATTKLGLSAISNAGQSVNTAAVYGIGPTLKSMFNFNNPVEKEFALRTGATVDEVLNGLRAETGATSKGVLSRLTAPGFKAVENFNRQVSANAGKRFAMDRFKALLSNPNDKVALEDLVKLGIDPTQAIPAGSLSGEDLLKAGQTATNITQFKVRPIDLPPTWSSSVGKLLTQFKNFSYKQGNFMNDQIIKPAIHGNVAPLARYITLGLLVGEGIGDAKAFVRGRDRPSNLLERAGDNITTVGGNGIINDAYNAALRGNEAMLKWISGPAVSDATAGITASVDAVNKLKAGKNPKQIESFALRNIPIIGQTLNNLVFPPKNPYKTRTPDLPFEVPGFTPNKTSMQIDPGSKSIVGADFFGQVPTANAAEVLPNLDPSKLTPLEKQQLLQKRSDLNKKAKGIYQTGGEVKLPIIGKISGLSDQEKNARLTEIDQQKKQIADRLKAPPKPESEQSVEGANYQLAVDEAKRSGSLNDYITKTNSYIDYLTKYKDSLDPQLKAATIARTQNKIEDLKSQKDKYLEQNGFKKAKKGASNKKVISALRKFKAPKLASVKTGSLKLTRTATPSVKLPNLKASMPKLKFAPLKKPLKLKANPLKLTYL